MSGHGQSEAVRSENLYRVILSGRIKRAKFEIFLEIFRWKDFLIERFVYNGIWNSLEEYQVSLLILRLIRATRPFPSRFSSLAYVVINHC